MLFLSVVVLVIGLSSGKTFAQNTSSSYRTGLGLGVDFGDGATMVGISGKHFFTDHNVGEANLMFFNGGAGINVLYEYHSDITGAAGLKWYAGLGPELLFGKHYTDFDIRPLIGLDYKIRAAPFALSFDWRPLFSLTHGTDFLAARFGLGIRYAF
ncbi:hypothetical protein GCM10023143_16090 [Compostibacter hankyongensis]|uniref:Outer membrane protein beta-barrel domain-containing protein n=1 Tax=Compostibacter hankyongensis TaxID=1007089 RepID=A0ABP8FPZ2_9BACT